MAWWAYSVGSCPVLLWPDQVLLARLLRLAFEEQPFLVVLEERPGLINLSEQQSAGHQRLCWASWNLLRHLCSLSSH